MEAAIATVQAEIEQRLAADAATVARLQTIPGVGATAAAVLVAEIGVDMSRFASAGHLVSWAGLCPGNRQSVGKGLSGRTRKGNVWLRAVLSDVAWAIAHTKDNGLSAQFHRLARRLGKKRAVVALAHKVLRIVYYLLRDGGEYREQGSAYWEQQEKERLERHHIRRLEQLGYTVVLTPAQAA